MCECVAVVAETWLVALTGPQPVRVKVVLDLSLFTCCKVVYLNEELVPIPEENHSIIEENRSIIASSLMEIRSIPCSPTARTHARTPNTTCTHVALM